LIESEAPQGFIFLPCFISEQKYKLKQLNT